MPLASVPSPLEPLLKVSIVNKRSVRFKNVPSLADPDQFALKVKTLALTMTPG